MCWKKRTPRNIGLCASTKSKICRTEEFKFIPISFEFINLWFFFYILYKIFIRTIFFSISIICDEFSLKELRFYSSLNGNSVSVYTMCIPWISAVVKTSSSRRISASSDLRIVYFHSRSPWRLLCLFLFKINQLVMLCLSCNCLCSCCRSTF